MLFTDSNKELVGINIETYPNNSQALGAEQKITIDMDEALGPYNLA